MPILLKISDAHPGGALSVDLRDLLVVLPVESHTWVWVVLDLDVVAGQGHPSVHRVVEQLDSGGRVIFNWHELEELAQRIAQTQDAVVAAVRDLATAQGLRLEADLVSTCEVVIEAVDTSYWLVFAREAKTLGQLRATYQHVQEMPASNLVLRTRGG